MPDEQPARTITQELAEKLGENRTDVQRDLAAFHQWLANKGKDPDRNKSLSPTASANYHNRIDQIFRFAIDLVAPENPTVITQDQADQIIKWLDEDVILTRSGQPYSEDAKRKFCNAMEKYFLWRHYERGAESTWKPKITFSQSRYESADKLNFTERWNIRKTAQEYGSLPAYYEVPPEERDQINGLVAQRIGKPKEDVSQLDWERADQSRKVGSLVAVALETGITPIEVEEARVDWYKPKRNLLRIPNEFASKDRPTTELPLTEDTGDLLSKWIQERRHYKLYDGTNRLWLNRSGNPYTSKNLCYLIRRLCKKAGIDHEERKIVWYSLRHNLGKSIEEEEDLSQASDQLRHRSIETTKLFYATSSIESRRHTLERVNETAQRTAEDPSFSPYADDRMSHRLESRTSPAESSSSTVPTKHIDCVIEDTPQARNQFVSQFLSQSDQN